LYLRPIEGIFASSTALAVAEGHQITTNIHAPSLTCCPVARAVSTDLKPFKDCSSKMSAK
jgi:hypothetical protein